MRYECRRWVNPKRGLEPNIWGLPVFASAHEAMKVVPFDVSLMFIPPAAAKDAALDAIEAGKAAYRADGAHPVTGCT